MRIISSIDVVEDSARVLVVSERDVGFIEDCMRRKTLQVRLISLAWILFLVSLPMPCVDSQNLLTIRLPVGFALLLFLAMAVNSTNHVLVLFAIEPIFFIVGGFLLLATDKSVWVWLVRVASVILLGPLYALAVVYSKTAGLDSYRVGFYVFAASQGIMFLACWSGYGRREHASSKRGFAVIPVRGSQDCGRDLDETTDIDPDPVDAPQAVLTDTPEELSDYWPPR